MEGWKRLPAQLAYNPIYRPTRHNWNASDGEWVQVTRWASSDRPVAQWQSLCEGNVSKGKSWTSYGCWFFVTPGSGVFVNVGRSLRFSSRQAARAFLSAADKSTPVDLNWCTRALELGYDSVQIGAEHASYMRHESGQERDVAEVVICSGRCASERVCGRCPPLELRTGFDARKRCVCDEQQPILGCAANAREDRRELREVERTRYAIVMAGEPRSALSEPVQHSFRRRLLNVLEAAGHAVDLHMTAVLGRGSSGTGSDAEAALFAKVVRAYRPASHSVLNASDTWSAFGSFRCPHGGARFGHNDQGSIYAWRNAELVLVQWVAIRACYRQLEAHERASGFRYDWIVRTRFDLAYLADLPLARLSPESAFIPYGIVPCHSDHIFVCPRALCRPYFTLLEIFESPHCVVAPRGKLAMTTVRGPFASGEPLQPHGASGPPDAPFAVVTQPDGVDQQWYALARYGDGRICKDGDVLPDCCGAPLLRLIEWPYAIVRGNAASGFLDNCGTLGVATGGRRADDGESRPFAAQTYTKAQLPAEAEARLPALYQSLRAECTALEAKAPSRWRRQKRSKDFSTAYSMNLASKLTPEASPGDALLLTWRCSDYEPHQFWRRACKARIAGSG